MATLAAPRRKRRPNFWPDTFRGYMFTLPVVLGLLIWTFGPMIASAFFSLTSYKIVSPPQWVGLQNYQDLTQDRVFGQSLVVTVKFAIMYILLGQSFSLMIALLLTRKVRGIALYRTAFYMPIVVPFVASSLLWRYLFNKEFGPINWLLRVVGIPPVNWLGSPDWALVSMVVISVWSNAVSTIVYVAGLQHIPEELHEAARIDGANPFQQLRYVTLPMLSPTVFFNMVTNLIAAFQFFVPAYIMTAGGPVKATYFYSLNLYEKAFKWLEMGYASAMAWIMFAIIIVLTLLVFRSSPLWVYYEGEVRK